MARTPADPGRPKARRGAGTARRRTAPADGGVAADPTVRLRLYCHGLGDCLLVELPTTGGQPYRLLIDCGLHSAEPGARDRLAAVIDDLVSVTGGRIDAVAGTHEHWDHLSAFLQLGDRWGAGAGLELGEVWMSWAENPADPDARRIDRFKGEATGLLRGLASTLELAGEGGLAAGLDGIGGFLFGAAGERVRTAREALKALAPVRYLEPGTLVPLPPEVAGVRIHVLGPPRSVALLHQHEDPAGGWRLAFGRDPQAMPLAAALALNTGRIGVRDDPTAPFEAGVGLPFQALRAGDAPAGAGAAPFRALQRFLWDHYFGPAAEPGGTREGGATRRIDGAWAEAAAELALQLDRDTNNTSLVLAAELVASGRVLLFAADAQAGNWKSWDEVVVPLPGGGVATGPGLVARTVFYKVGHHGSHNATRRDGGLERMDRANLVAFSPTSAERAERLRWRDFPAARLVERLETLTGGRYIQSDAAWIADPAAPIPVQPGGALRSIARSPGPSVTLVIG